MNAYQHVTGLWLFSSLLTLLLCSNARGQTGAGLLLKPWPADQFLETTTDGYALDAAHSPAGENVQVSQYDSEGRIRLEPGNIASPRLGYDLHFLNTNSKSGVIPRDLTDLSIAVGSAVGQYHGWIVGMTVGAGYAGDAGFSRGFAWYAKGTFDIGKQFTDHDALAFMVDYDGNRPYFPDIPLPGAIYRQNFDDNLFLALGLPYSNIQWTPFDKLKFEASYCLAHQFTARVGYEIVKHTSIFVSYHYVQEAFHIAGLGSDQRLLFSDQRVETGIEYAPTAQFVLRLTGGYAFDNRFDRGFGFEDTHAYLPFGDAAYVGMSVEWRM